MMTFIQNLGTKTPAPVVVAEVQPDQTVKPIFMPAKQERYNLRSRRPVVYTEPASDEETELR
jgi:hypothetical protein